MSLEQAILDNTAAVRELIARLSALPAPAAASALPPAMPDAPKGSPKAPAQTKAYQEGAAKTAADAAKAPAAEPKPDAQLAGGKTAGQAAEALSGHANEPATLVTYDQAKAKVLEVAKVKGRQVASDVLARVGATRLPEVKPAMFGQVVELCDRALAGEDIAAGMEA
jgi:hypothetical protein